MDLTFTIPGGFLALSNGMCFIGFALASRKGSAPGSSCTPSQTRIPPLSLSLLAHQQYLSIAVLVFLVFLYRVALFRESAVLRRGAHLPRPSRQHVRAKVKRFSQTSGSTNDSCAGRDKDDIDRAHGRFEDEAEEERFCCGQTARQQCHPDVRYSFLGLGLCRKCPKTVGLDAVSNERDFLLLASNPDFLVCGLNL